MRSGAWAGVGPPSVGGRVDDPPAATHRRSWSIAAAGIVLSRAA
jgi:hypothetical protein